MRAVAFFFFFLRVVIFFIFFIRFSSAALRCQGAEGIGRGNSNSRAPEGQRRQAGAGLSLTSAATCVSTFRERSMWGEQGSGQTPARGPRTMGGSSRLTQGRLSYLPLH